MKYFFLTVTCKPYKADSFIRNLVLSEYPLAFLERHLSNEEYMTTKIALLFYKEISEEEYNLLKPHNLDRDDYFDLLEQDEVVDVESEKLD